MSRHFKRQEFGTIRNIIKCQRGFRVFQKIMAVRGDLPSLSAGPSEIPQSIELFSGDGIIDLQAFICLPAALIKS